MKTALVLGGGGFIGSHLVKRLKDEGYWVRAVDIKHPQFSKSPADQFGIADLRDVEAVSQVMRGPDQKTMTNKETSFDEVYQLAADMGGAGYIFTGEHDAEVLCNSGNININVAKEALLKSVKKIFFSSSACIYPAYNQEDPNNPKCSEESAYPAAPDSEYGWEKLFSERLYLAMNRNYGLNVRIGRYHNIYGPGGTYNGGREKAPAALCRKVVEAKDRENIEVWGTGNQTRSFLYIDDCIDATIKLMRSDFTGPVNIGSEEMISINGLAKMIIGLSKKDIKINNIDGPVGVNGRNSDNNLINSKLLWKPSFSLKDGMSLTYNWIASQYENSI